MKYIKNSLLPLIVIAIALTVVGCEKNDVVGIWREKGEVTGDVSVGSDANEYIFEKDGTYQHSIQNATVEHGEYEIEGDKIVTKSDNGKKTIKIVKKDKEIEAGSKKFEKKSDSTDE
ncbi:hypothetical protein LDL00_11560 [Staphylococcus epidermidis]|uniref:hypothetical protein n=1 Tax=Staphylococcus epidermidis TaxID=1282 RepID=UPI001E321231|nr:hypothetical protein [Staphylococcus epidermidis]MCD9074461.1 hypothetical protein [Staphylococcus epidermidis]